MVRVQGGEVIKKANIAKYKYGNILWYATIEALVHEYGEANLHSLENLFHVSNQAVRKQVEKYQKLNPGVFIEESFIRPYSASNHVDVAEYEPFMFYKKADRLHWLSMIEVMFGGTLDT